MNVSLLFSVIVNFGVSFSVRHKDTGRPATVGLAGGGGVAEWVDGAGRAGAGAGRRPGVATRGPAPELRES